MYFHGLDQRKPFHCTHTINNNQLRTDPRVDLFVLAEAEAAAGEEGDFWDRFFVRVVALGDFGVVIGGWGLGGVV